MKDYPQLSVRLPGEIRSMLQAASLVSGRPQWRILSDAIEAFVKARPDTEQRLIADLQHHGRARRSRR